MLCMCFCFCYIDDTVYGVTWVLVSYTFSINKCKVSVFQLLMEVLPTFFLVSSFSGSSTDISLFVFSQNRKMIRKQARLRREYMYRKSLEMKENAIQSKKDRLKLSLDQNRKIPTDLRKEALTLQSKLKWDDGGPELAAAYGAEEGDVGSSQDDEYRWAGVEDPKVMITTSRDPSSRLVLCLNSFCFNSLVITPELNNITITSFNLLIDFELQVENVCQRITAHYPELAAHEQR